ncbi:type III secretion system export apparatus subunit SctU [Marivita sp. S0852]|uniref:type III secretion system export apparatus subunit SctU n=1 Tax=Marivita sp. S0852 TaxID=3373893 RepID=UPI003982326B
MSETGEKTEQPTPKKERDARQKGQVARSQEVVTTISLFGVIVVILALGGEIWWRLINLMDTVALLATKGGVASLKTGIAVSFDIGVLALLPVIGVTLALGIVANYVQFGSLFSIEAITPKLEKISITKGFKRIFCMRQVVELIKSVFKILFLSLLLYYVTYHAIGAYFTAISCGMVCLQSVTVRVLYQVTAYSALAFVIVALFDFWYQRHAHTKSLMMSKEEVKREFKESEGDPLTKGQRKQFAQELVMGDAPKQVENASALVVNPTHIAVAIRYREGQTPLPMVTARARGPEAQRLRVVAEQSGVPVFRNIALARGLYADTVPGDYVPDEVFSVVAEILAWIARHEGELYDGPARRGDIDMERGDHKVLA